MTDIRSTGSARVVQAVWVAVAAALTLVGVIAVGTRWGTLSAACSRTAACTYFQVDASSARTLSEHGVSVIGYAAFTIAILIATWVIWYGVAGLIIWRKPEDRGAVICAFSLVLLPALELSFWVPSSTGWWTVWSNILAVIGGLPLLLFCLLFPDGRFVPRWTRYLAAAIVLMWAIGILPAVSATSYWYFEVVVPMLAVIGVQVYRFRSVSTWSQRQQAKWAFSGITVALVFIVALFVGFLVLPETQTQNGSLYAATFISGFAVVTTVIPVSIGLAVLRSRLWDIDRIISRALVYACLTATLGAIYIASVLGLQALLGLVSRQSSNVSIAVSTLVVVALFAPLRRRIQTGIDRRFYRSRYDAAETLSRLAGRLHDEVDLGALCEDVLFIVHDTLKPEHVSLWLRVTDGKASDGTDGIWYS